MEKEITLADYGRVLWRGKWVLLVAALGAAAIALITSLARETTYTSSSIVYMGLATTARTGVPVSTPYTTPATAQRAILSDEFIDGAARATGVDRDRIKDGIAVSVERVPGAAGGNQPTVATLRYSDSDRDTAIRVTNAYADTVFGKVQGFYEEVLAAQERISTRGEERIAQIQRTLDRLRAQGQGDSPNAVSLQQELATVQLSADEAALNLAKTRQIEQPQVISQASTAVSSSRPGELIRTVIFGAFLGLILGAIITFIWLGSPAGRAADARGPD